MIVSTLFSLLCAVGLGAKEPMFFSLQQIGPCNDTNVPIFCWSEGVSQALVVNVGSSSVKSEIFTSTTSSSNVFRLDAFIDSQGNEVGTLFIRNSTTSLRYKAILDHHVANGEFWTGFMAGEVVAGSGAYEGAQGVVTFTARQIDPMLCNGSTFCYAKFVSVQVFI